jgi:hypothetical protein
MDINFCLHVPCKRMNAFVTVIVVFITYQTMLSEALLFAEVNAERIV